MPQSEFATPANAGQPLADLLRRLTSGQETVFDVARDLSGPNGETQTIRVGHRALQPEPPAEKALARSPQRAHVFHTAEAVAAYLARYGGEGTVMLADAPSRSALIVLDETAKSGFEQLAFAPPYDPRLLPWLGLIGKPSTLDAFSAFVISRRADVKHMSDSTGNLTGDGRDLALLLRQVKVSKSATLYTGLGATSVNGVVTTFRAVAGGPDEQLTIELPDAILLELPIFLATPPVEIRLDLTLDGRGETVTVLVTAPDLERAVLDLFNQLLDRIRTMLAAGNPGFTIYQELGSVAHAPWAVV